MGTILNTLQIMSLYPTKLTNMKNNINKNMKSLANFEENKILIKLKSFNLNELIETCNIVASIANETGATLSGPIPLPMKKKTFCVLRSPHVNKDSREHFEIRTYTRLFQIKDWSSETVDQLMAYEVPSGVDVRVKL